MAKFHGTLGFVNSVETSPGVYEEVPTERPVKGDILRNSRQWEEANSQVNSDLVLFNRFTIVGDPYIYDNIGAIRYLEVFGTKWEIGSLTIERPRIIIRVNGVYNG